MKKISEMIKGIVTEHIKMIDTGLPDFIESYYIYGSVSIGAFDYGYSDIDFVAIIKRKPTNAEINILRKLHADMHRKYHATVLDGMYLLKDDIELLKSNSEIPCLRFNDGEFKGYKSFNKDSIDAFELKKYGVTIKGPTVDKLEFSADFDNLISNMRTNLNTYWIKWLNARRRFPSNKSIGLFISLKELEWGVLGISRLYYTFREKDITSKIGAGEYALLNVPQKWHNIIKESMRLRKNDKNSYYNSVLKRRNDALGYMDFIIQECNKLYIGQ